jgi:hypothetical protein
MGARHRVIPDFDYEDLTRHDEFFCNRLSVVTAGNMRAQGLCGRAPDQAGGLRKRRARCAAANTYVLQGNENAL